MMYKLQLVGLNTELCMVGLQRIRYVCVLELAFYHDKVFLRGLRTVDKIFLSVI